MALKEKANEDNNEVEEVVREELNQPEQQKPTSRQHYTRSRNTETRTEKQEHKVTQSYNFRNDGPLLSVNSGAGDLAKFVEIARDFLKQNESIISLGGKLKWTVIPATAKATEMRLDGAVIAARTEDTGDMFASTILFTGNQILPKQTIPVGRDTVRFTATPNDQYTDPDYLRRLDQLLEATDSSLSESEIVHVAMTPIFNEKITEAEHTRIAASVIEQVIYYVKSVIGTNNFSIKALDLKNNELLANISFQQGDTFEPISELPHRSDVRVDLTVAPRDDRRNQIVNVMSDRQQRQLVGLTAHVDLYYIGKNEQESGYRRRRSENEDTRIYGTNFIFTDIQCNPIPEYLMFSLAQIAALIREQVALQGLRPLSQKGALRTYDALTYEQEEEFLPLPEQLSDKEWLDLASNVIQEKSQIVSIQVPRSALSTPMLRLLVEACDYDNPRRKEAADILIMAADSVTNDLFSDTLNPEDLYDIGELKTMPALLGTWVDEQGRTRDLREIGYYEILTHYGKKNPIYVQDWEECLNNEAIDVQERMDRMEAIIDDYTGGQYRITDRSDVVEINTRWIFGLTDAAKKAGMVVTADGISQDTRAYRRGFSSRFATDDYTGDAYRTRGRSSYGFGRN